MAANDVDFDEVIDKLLVHAAAAGRALRNKVTDVAFGNPVPTSSRCIRAYYTGEVAPEKIGGTRVLDGSLIAERLVIVGFWAIPNNAIEQSAVIEREVRQFKHELRTRILLDSDIGGEASDVSLGYAEVDWGVSNNTVYRTLELEVLIEYIEYEVAK